MAIQITQDPINNFFDNLPRYALDLKQQDDAAKFRDRQLSENIRQFNERQAQLAASPEKDDRGTPTTPQEARASAQRAADRLGTSLATRGRAKGGLMETPKPKAKKKMKRGGLASKK